MRKPSPLPVRRSDGDPSALEERDFYKKKIKQSLFHVTGYIVFLVAIGIVLFSIPSIRPPSEGIYTWIERFGALVGILSLLIDFKLKESHEHLEIASMSLPKKLFQSLKSSYKYIPCCEKIALGFAIGGAITWAYGTVIIYWVSCLIE